MRMMAENRAVKRSFAQRAVAWATLSALALSFAATVPAQAGTCGCSRCSSSSWRVVETANFRFLVPSSHKLTAEVTAECEQLRHTLTSRWLGEATAWKTKCEIVLHPSDQSYLHEVGAGGGSTVASSLVDRLHGKITRRRVDIRRATPGWPAAALAHELMHVIVADLFPVQSLPRWADEGLAILADPPEKQRQHRTDLATAINSGHQFRMTELVALADYPAADRWGAFYGQSTYLVEYLVELGGEAKLIEMVRAA